MLTLLDLTIAFDTVDHNILLSRLEHVVGLKSADLSWFKSYQSVRSFSISMGKHFSSQDSICCGVPQGSILGPTLYAALNMKYNIPFHSYANDIYCPVKLDVSLQPLFNCLHDVKS